MQIDNWNKQQVHALVIVAHPDDETIFMGGTILKYPDWNWKIVNVTHDSDSLRVKELQSALDKYKKFGVSNISAVSLGVEDSYDTTVADNQRDELKSKLKPVFEGEHDVVFTHNSKGDYGHPQHILINKAVNEFAKVPVWEFICLGAEKVVPAPYKEFIHLTVLDVQDLEQKLEIFKSYPSQISFFSDLPTIARYEFKTGPEIFVSDSRFE